MLLLKCGMPAGVYPRKHRTLLERIRKNVDIDPVRGCWLWRGALNADGYVHLGLGGGKTALGHRVLWLELHGPLSAEECVCHRCDVPRCCNPDHLYLGTHQDNMRDRNEKGRQARGERQGRAKLTAAEVLAIRADPRSQYRLGRAYGVHQTTVGRIKRGDLWRYLFEEQGDG